MIDVCFLVLADTLLLDLAGPAEAFRLANQQLRRRGRPEAFRLRFLGPQASVRSSVGLQLAGLEPLPEALPDGAWLLLLGRPGDAPRVVEPDAAWLEARDWLTRVLAPRLGEGAVPADAPAAPGRLPAGAPGTLPPWRLMTVCVGTLLAADAGLLGRRRVTTHHEMLDELLRLAPTAQVQANRVFVEDGPLLTSAGITAGIDMALHAVAAVCGEAVSAAVAQVMVVFTRRAGQAPQRSPMLEHRDHLHPALHRVQDAVGAAPQEPWPLERLAAVAHVTPRHLGRLFQAHCGLTPRDYVESLRVALAEQAAGRGAPPRQAAGLSGFSSPRQWRRARDRRTAR